MSVEQKIAVARQRFGWNKNPITQKEPSPLCSYYAMAMKAYGKRIEKIIRDIKNMETNPP
jgi:hypothetical protein